MISSLVPLWLENRNYNFSPLKRRHFRAKYTGAFTHGGSMVKSPPVMHKTWAWSLDWADPQEKGMATHSSILAWRIPWIEASGGLVYGVTKSCIYIYMYIYTYCIDGSCFFFFHGKRRLLLFKALHWPGSWVKVISKIQECTRDGQGGLACCSPRGCKESVTIKQLNWSGVISPSPIVGLGLEIRIWENEQA